MQIMKILKAFWLGVLLSVGVFPLTARGDDSSVLQYMPAVIAASTSPDSGTTVPQIGHDSIQGWNGTATCLECHTKEAEDVFSSVHYQWLGKTPYLNNGPELQGKLDVGVNSYCINITGNWNGCGNCHIGLGARPEQVKSRAQLENIDCMVCHQEQYKRKKVNGVFVPDEANMPISMLKAARTVHKPTRATCLPCHAKGGGGDNYKRGDMALAHVATSDRNFDVHMATTEGNLTCQQCHTTQDHLMAGRGSDLRPTELDVQMNCSECHVEEDESTPHDDEKIDNHLARVACQSCHIPTYARNASDTTSTEQTEVHRDWLKPHVTPSGAIHPTPTMAGDLVPRYKWWNGYSSNYLLHDPAVVDPETARIPTSRPLGAVNDSNSKLYPFKYKTALQPLANQDNVLIALDTSVYFTSGDPEAATISGLHNMGLSASSDYSWVETDTFQLITHEVSPESSALRCTSCHGSKERMDLQGELGYHLKGAQKDICVKCHEWEEVEKPGYAWIHDKHVKDKKYDCSWCHTFDRPERGLKKTK